MIDTICTQLEPKVAPKDRLTLPQLTPAYDQSTPKTVKMTQLQPVRLPEVQTISLRASRQLGGLVTSSSVNVMSGARHFTIAHRAAVAIAAM